MRTVIKDVVIVPLAIGGFWIRRATLNFAKGSARTPAGGLAPPATNARLVLARPAVCAAFDTRIRD